MFTNDSLINNCDINSLQLKIKKLYIVRCSDDDIECHQGLLVQSKASAKLHTVRMSKVSGAMDRAQKNSVNH